jgi:hypothetical protein
MTVKRQTIYDLKSDQFKYLKREKDNHLHKVDINELNKRLNKVKKINFFNTATIMFLCFSCLAILTIISMKF